MFMIHKVIAKLSELFSRKKTRATFDRARHHGKGRRGEKGPCLSCHEHTCSKEKGQCPCDVQHGCRVGKGHRALGTDQKCPFAKGPHSMDAGHLCPSKKGPLDGDKCPHGAGHDLLDSCRKCPSQEGPCDTRSTRKDPCPHGRTIHSKCTQCPCSSTPENIQKGQSPPALPASSEGPGEDSYLFDGAVGRLCRCEGAVPWSPSCLLHWANPMTPSVTPVTPVTPVVTPSVTLSVRRGSGGSEGAPVGKELHVRTPHQRSEGRSDRQEPRPTPGSRLPAGSGRAR